MTLGERGLAASDCSGATPRESCFSWARRQLLQGNGAERNPRKVIVPPRRELCHVSLQAMSTWRARLARSLKPAPGRMHPFPCSALLACFGNARDSAAFDPPGGPDTPPAVYDQPAAKAARRPSHPQAGEGTPEARRDSGTQPERNGSAHRGPSDRAAAQPVEAAADTPGLRDGGPACEAAAVQASIPRPSIIEMPVVSTGTP